jgi:hypothetical protein
MIKRAGLILLGAAVGGVVGYFAFRWLLGQGFYALILPGGLLGFGAAIVRGRSIVPPIICGLAGLALGVFAEWSMAPFITDGSLGYFLAHLGDLRPLTLILIALGGAIGFWMPFRRIEKAPPSANDAQERPIGE